MKGLTKGKTIQSPERFENGYGLKGNIKDRNATISETKQRGAGRKMVSNEVFTSFDNQFKEYFSKKMHSTYEQMKHKMQEAYLDSD